MVNYTYLMTGVCTLSGMGIESKRANCDLGLTVTTVSISKADLIVSALKTYNTSVFIYM